LEKKQEEYALEYAGFWIRLGASAIDSAILLFISWIISGTLIAVFQGNNIATSGLSLGDIIFRSRFILIPMIGIMTGWLIEIAYLICFWAWRGQTPGKMAVGIKIIRTDRSPITWANAILRYLGYIVSTLTLFIGFLWIAFDSRKQGLHDKIAGTYVVKLPVKQVVFTESYIRGEAG